MGDIHLDGLDLSSLIDSDYFMVMTGRVPVIIKSTYKSPSE